MYGPAIVIKLARVVNAACLLYMVQRGNGAKTIVDLSAAVWDSPLAKSELFLQLVDDMYVLLLSKRISPVDSSGGPRYVSTLFLMTIHTGVKFTGNQRRRHSSDPGPPFSQGLLSRTFCVTITPTDD